MGPSQNGQWVVFESSGVGEAVVDVVLEVSGSSGDAAEVVEESVGICEPAKP